MTARWCALILTGFLAVACSYPKTRVTSGSEPPSLAVTGLDSRNRAELFVNGISYGRATQFDGRSGVLVLSPGPHEVVIRDEGQVVFTRNVLLTSGATTTVAVE